MLLVTLPAGSAAEPGTSIEQWLPTPATLTVQLSMPNPQKEALRQELKEDLEWYSRKLKYVVAADLVLWAGCFAAAIKGQLGVAPWICSLAVGGIVPLKYIRQDIINSNRELRRLGELTSSVDHRSINCQATGRSSWGGPRVHAVEHERVDVEVQIQGRPEALDHRDRPALSFADAVACGRGREPAEHHAHEHREHIASQGGVEGQRVAQR